MVSIISAIISDVLSTLYQQFWCSVVLSILFMFFLVQAREKGWKQLIKQWINNWKTEKNFRVYFLLSFYVSMMLLRTILNRGFWRNSLSNVIGTWGLYYADGKLCTEGIQNLLLFIPFTILWMICFPTKVLRNKKFFCNIMKRTIKVSAIFALSIEFLQLFLQVGTFQLSDIFYNVLGGLVGGLIYWIGYKFTHRKK